jgi:K+-transporting ATPase KdpF subunit
MLALAMSGDDLAGLIVSALIVGYLVYALVFPERL